MSKCAGASSLLLEAIMKITHVEKYNTLKNPYNDLNIFFPTQMWPLVLFEKMLKNCLFSRRFHEFQVWKFIIVSGHATNALFWIYFHERTIAPY